MSNLTAEEILELNALRLFNDALNGPTFQLRSNWHGVYARLARRGLIAWGEPPEGFAKSRFAGVTITESGRQTLAAAGIGVSP